jgi:hypothetical protein
MLVQNRLYASVPRAAKRNAQPTMAATAWPRPSAVVKHFIRKTPIDIVGYRKIPSRFKPQRLVSAAGAR